MNIHIYFFSSILLPVSSFVLALILLLCASIAFLSVQSIVGRYPLVATAKTNATPHAPPRNTKLSPEPQIFRKKFFMM